MDRHTARHLILIAVFLLLGLALLVNPPTAPTGMQTAPLDPALTNLGGAQPGGVQINVSDVYELTSNITGCTGVCVNISVSNVVLDCKGFAILSDGNAAAGDHGIIAGTLTSNITIRNCTIEGFDDGIRFDAVADSTVDNNIIKNNDGTGFVDVSTVPGGNNVNITNNLARSNNAGFNATASPITGYYFRGNNATNNTLSGYNINMQSFSGFEDNYASNNKGNSTGGTIVARSTGGGGGFLGASDSLSMSALVVSDFNITNNTAVNNNGGGWVFIANQTNMIDNIGSFNNGTGIAVIGTNITIINNTANNNSQTGYNITSTLLVDFSGNTANGNRGANTGGAIHNTPFSTGGGGGGPPLLSLGLGPSALPDPFAVVRDNIANNNNGTGWKFSGFNRTNFINNSATGNTGTGIIFHNITNSSIEQTTSLNNNVAVNISQSADNNFTNNRMQTFNTGLLVESSSFSRMIDTVLHSARFFTGTWLTVDAASLANLTNTSFNNSDGKIFYNTTLNLSSLTVTGQDLNISPNFIRVNSSNISDMNTSARLTLRNLVGNDSLLVDFEDDGTFATCNAPQCQQVSFANNILVFDVASFTSYKANSTLAGVNITLTKTDDPDPVDQDGTLTYTIVVNVTNGTAFNATVADTFPAGVTFESASPAPDGGTNGTFSLGDLTGPTTSTITINVTVTGSDTLTNNATLTFQNASGTDVSLSVEQTTTVTSEEVQEGGGGSASRNAGQTGICPAYCRDERNSHVAICQSEVCRILHEQTATEQKTQQVALPTPSPVQAPTRTQPEADGSQQDLRPPVYKTEPATDAAPGPARPTSSVSTTSIPLGLILGILGIIAMVVLVAWEGYVHRKQIGKRIHTAEEKIEKAIHRKKRVKRKK